MTSDQEHPEFKDITPKQTVDDGRLGYLKKGYVKITNFAVYFGDLTMNSLGQPEYVALAIDTKRHMIRLSPAKNRTGGWAPRPSKNKSDINQYALHATKHKDMQKLPNGLYIPTGGEVYAYKEEFN